MILALNTASPTCYLRLIDNEVVYEHDWEANRMLADGLIQFLRESLNEHERTWDDIEGIIVFQGPGSFTGLRIGITVVNTLADARLVPIVGVSGDDWVTAGVNRLSRGENDQLVLPKYGREANITSPRK